MANRQRKPHTGFGIEMGRFMASRSIRSWTHLSERIEEATGRKYVHQSISRYAAGTTKIPAEFAEDFATTLNLDETERTELAVQFTYHSRPKQPG